MGGLFSYEMWNTYKADKFVRIQSWEVAVGYRLVQVCIAVYVLWSIVYQGDHLVRVPVHGYPTVLAQFLREDIAPPSDLAYCEQSNSSLLSSTNMCECERKDDVDLREIAPDAPGTVRLPTHITTITQEWDSNGSHWRSKPDWRQRYLTEIESFTIMVEYNLLPTDRTERLTPKGEICFQTDKELLCAPKTICEPQTQKARPLPNLKTAFTCRDGLFWMEVADLVRLSDPDLNLALDNLTEDGKTFRKNGIVLSVEVEVTQERRMAPYGDGHISTTVRVHRLPLTIGAVFTNARRLPENGREVDLIKGLVTSVAVSGSLYVFDWVSLLQMLTTSYALLALANVVAEFCMTQFMANRDHFKHLLVEETEALDGDVFGSYGKASGTLVCDVDMSGKLQA